MKARRYLFELGNNPIISTSELNAVFKSKIVSSKYLVEEIFELEIALDESDSLENRLKSLGGIKKAAIILKTLPKDIDTKNLIQSICFEIEKISTLSSQKINVGINTYNFHTSLKSIGMEIKKILKNKKINLRIVNMDNKNLNSVSIIRNKLISNRGIDINIVSTKEQIILAKSVFCQNSLDYSKRDYGRPRRNAKSGMLPPKLAQIMLNIANLKEGEKFLDPFCGSGTILQEGLLKDFECYGSDLTDESILSSTENLTWLADRYMKDPDAIKKIHIKKLDAKRVHTFGSTLKAQAIVSEGTLGPPLLKNPTLSFADKIIRDIMDIYVPFFENAPRILDKNALIIMTFPVFKINQHQVVFSKDELLKKISKNYEIVNIINKDLINNYPLLKSIGLRCVYGRSDQIVLREIVALRSR